MADITAGERFTPGPWRVVGKTGYINGVDNTGHHVGEVQVAKVGDFFDKELLPFNRDRWTADARLIAAAPELYEACRVALGYLTCGMDGNWRKDVDPVDVLRAALAKSEGQP